MLYGLLFLSSRKAKKLLEAAISADEKNAPNAFALYDNAAKKFNLAKRKNPASIAKYEKWERHCLERSLELRKAMKSAPAGRNEPFITNRNQGMANRKLERANIDDGNHC